MRSRLPRTLAATAVALLVLAPAALGQGLGFRYRTQAGRLRVYETRIRTETTVRAGDKTVKTIKEIPLRREEFVADTKADPPSMRVVTQETPAGERLLAYEENGQNRLDSIPEANRLRPMPPLLAAQWRDLAGRPQDKPPAPTGIMQAIDQVQADMRLPPAKPLKPGESESRELDLGVVKATLTTKFVEQAAVGSVPAAILEVKAALTFTANPPPPIQIEKMEGRMAWATDGSGWLSVQSNLILIEKSAQAEQRIVRTLQEKFTEQTDVDAAELAKARTQLEQLEAAMTKARTDDLDAAIETLDTFLRDYPTGRWSTAVQYIHSNLSRRRLVTKEVPKPRLRLMLRDLQAARDQAGARGGPEEIAQIDQAIRQVITINAKAIFEDAIEPDPILRDLAAFGLAFLDDPQAGARLKAMIKDGSPQVQGTAAVSLAVRGDTVAADDLAALLKSSDERTRGAAALLIARSVKKGDPQAVALLPPLIENLKVSNAWSRLNTAATIAAIAPTGSAASARAVLAACKAEKEPRLKPAYLDALKRITGVEAADTGPFEEWLKKQPAEPPKPEEPKPPAQTEPAKTPAPKG